MATKQELINRLNNLKLSDASWETQDQAIYQLLQDIINTAFELTGETGTLALGNVEPGDGIVATGSDNSQDKTIFSIQRKEVLDTNQQPREDTRIQSIGDISFYTGGEVGTEMLRVKAEGTVISNSLLVSQNNAMGGGIILADDGDIVDLNDGYCSMRFSNGVKIYNARRGGEPTIEFHQTGDLNNVGNIKTAGNLIKDNGSLGVLKSNGAAQGLKSGSLVVSDDYNDAAPINGIYCKGVAILENSILRTTSVGSSSDEIVVRDTTTKQLKVTPNLINPSGAQTGQSLTFNGSKFVPATPVDSSASFQNLKSQKNSNINNGSISLVSAIQGSTSTDSTRTFVNNLPYPVTLVIETMILARRDAGGNEHIDTRIFVDGAVILTLTYILDGDTQVPCLAKYNLRVESGQTKVIKANAFVTSGTFAYFYGNPIINLLVV